MRASGSARLRAVGASARSRRSFGEGGSEPGERRGARAPASEPVGESEGRSPSEKARQVMRMKPCDIGAEAAEQYVAGSMPEPERTSFEDHFFACEDCFQTVQALETARGVLVGNAFPQIGHTTGGFLRGSRRGLPLRWMAAAATVIVIVGLGVIVRRGLNPIGVPSRTEAVPEAIAATQVAASTSPAPAVSVPAPNTVPGPASQSPARPNPPRPTSEGRLERWARVVPPQYVALTTRSAQDPDADESSRRFAEAMAHYSAGRYSEAAAGLQVLADARTGGGTRALLPRHL